MTEVHEPTKFFEGKEVDDNRLQEIRDNLQPSERLVEISPNHFKVLKRLQE